MITTGTDVIEYVSLEFELRYEYEPGDPGEPTTFSNPGSPSTPPAVRSFEISISGQDVTDLAQSVLVPVDKDVYGVPYVTLAEKLDELLLEKLVSDGELG